MELYFKIAILLEDTKRIDPDRQQPLTWLRTKVQNLLPPDHHFDCDILPEDYLLSFSPEEVAYHIGRCRDKDLQDILVYPDEFENKYVFIGASAIGLQDIKTTSISAKTPGVMLHASTLSNILENDFLIPPSKVITYLTVIFLISLTTLLLLKYSNLLFFLIYPSLIILAYTIWGGVWFKFNHIYEIASPVIIKMPINEGDRVSRGQILVELDRTDVS